MSDKAFIQIQDITGDWKTVQTVMKQDQMIKKTVDSVAKQFKKIARAVDDKGNILQLTGG
jgi:hypothetical protein